MTLARNLVGALRFPAPSEHILALCMGLHPRLGAASRFHTLDEACVYQVSPRAPEKGHSQSWADRAANRALTAARSPPLAQVVCILRDNVHNEGNGGAGVELLGCAASVEGNALCANAEHGLMADCAALELRCNDVTDNGGGGIVLRGPATKCTSRDNALLHNAQFGLQAPSCPPPHAPAPRC